MLFNALAVSSLLVAVAVAAPEPAPYRIGMMSTNPAFGLAKRQAGYQPTQTQCGPGTTCAESCGADYVTCPSTDGALHCYDPAIQDSCCPDGTGNSCSAGYFCTQDTSGGTWCCPNGMSLAACAAAYSLTGVLASETPTSLPTAGGSLTGSPATTTPPATTSAGSSTVVPHLPSTTAIGTLSSAPPTKNSTIISASPTTSKTSQFTGAANANGVMGGLLALGIAGVVAAL